MLRSLSKQSGLSLVEIIVTIGLTGIIILIIGSATVLIAIDRGTKYRSWGTALALEELEMVSSQPFANLTNRTNAIFSWVPYNYGVWQVATVSGAPSAPNALELKNGSVLASSVSGLALMPISQATSITAQTSVKVSSDSPSFWSAGLAFGIVDQSNYYRLRISSANLLLEKISNGTESTLYNLSQVFSTNTWYTIKVVTTSTTIETWMNGLLKNTYTGTISGGEVGLVGLNGVHAYFDDATVTTSGTTSWNFDSETIGAPPQSWNRFGLYDFSGAAGKLTIADYGGDTNIKQITVRVEWPEMKGTRNTTFTTLKSKY